MNFIRNWYNALYVSNDVTIRQFYDVTKLTVGGRERNRFKIYGTALEHNYLFLYTG